MTIYAGVGRVQFAWVRWIGVANTRPVGTRGAPDRQLVGSSTPKGAKLFRAGSSRCRAIRGMCGGQNTEGGSVTTGPTMRRWAVEDRGGRGVVTSTDTRCHLLRNTTVNLLQRGTCVYCLRYLMRPERISGHHQLTSMPRRSGAPLRPLALAPNSPLGNRSLVRSCPAGAKTPQPSRKVTGGLNLLATSYMASFAISCPESR